MVFLLDHFGYAALWACMWAWVCSPWLRFALLPGLTPHRGIPLWVWPWDPYSRYRWPGAE